MRRYEEGGGGDQDGGGVGAHDHRQRYWLRVHQKNQRRLRHRHH